MKKLAILLVLNFIWQYGWSQTVLENNPATLRWEQIDTDHFRVIFPKGFDTQAQRMANTLEHIRSAETRTLRAEPRRLSVILQNQSSISNGFASLLPRRSEFFTMPPQDYNFVGTNDWLDLLATHEFRHIVQYQHATRGFNKAMYYAFGPTTLMAFAQAAAPQWFWEGDAVVTETALTPSGRGRIPNFSLIFKTNLLEGRTFNYHKQYLRSYKHQIPNHYVLGYYMVSHLRRESADPNIWSDITARAWNVPFIPFTFSNSIHKKTGKYVTELFNNMAADLKKGWQVEVDQLKLTPFQTINKRGSKAYTDYLYPQPISEDSLIVMKRGIGDIDQFIIIDRDGNERKMFTPGFVNDAGMLSVANGRVVWSEYGYDPRWPVRNYSVIKLYNITSKYKKVIGGRKSRLSGAALSPDGSSVAAVESANNYQASLQIFDVARGKRIKSFPNPENTFISMPRWSGNGKAIVYIKTDKTGKRISTVSVANGASTDILNVGHENVGHPVIYGNYIFFNSPVAGIDNIFAFDMDKKIRYQVTTSRYGAYNPAVSDDGDFIYYNEQTRDGQDVARIPFDPGGWQPFQVPGSSLTERLAEEITAQEGDLHLLDSVPKRNYPVTKFSKLKGIVNPYSWGAYVSNDLTQINVGISSRDILSTTEISGGYMFDINEQTSSWFAGISYQGWYPILDISVRAGGRENDERYGRYDLEFSWREASIEGGARLPFNFTNSKYVTRLSIGDAIGFTRTTDFRNVTVQNGNVIYDGSGRDVPAFDSLRFIYKDQLNDGDLVFNHFTFSFSNLLKRSPRDFLSRWGQTLAVNYYNTPLGGDFKARLFAAQASFYFPGFFKHHFLYGRIGYQKSFQGIERNTYIFRNMIAKPRGHDYPTDETFFSISANYALPLWYPDIALGPVLNIQRVKANFFYDYGKGTGNIFYYKPNSGLVYVAPTGDTYQSVGVETTFDFNVMRFLPKFELGFRSTYRFENMYSNGGTVFEIVIGNIAF
jgi:hypothetical protein